jgi:hypothetical protein
LVQVKAEAANNDSDETGYEVLISRIRDGRLATFEVTSETMLSPGDVVDVKLKRPKSEQLPSILNQAASDVDPASYVMGGTATK